MKSKTPLAHTFLFILYLLLSACGGGGGGGGSSANSGGTTGGVPSSSNGGSGGNQQEVYSASLSWHIPDVRENGEPLEVHEIGGYELQYKLSTDPTYTSIVINDGSVDSFEITNLVSGRYQFRMASFDTARLYSAFTDPLTASIGS